MNNRCFQLLGLREDATRTQIEEAYAKRCKKYKAADFADDPDYVKKKLFELKVAYDDAVAISSGMNPHKTSEDTYGQTSHETDTSYGGHKKLDLGKVINNLGDIKKNINESKLLDEFDERVNRRFPCASRKSDYEEESESSRDDDYEGASKYSRDDDYEGASAATREKDYSCEMADSGEPEENREQPIYNIRTDREKTIGGLILTIVMIFIIAITMIQNQDDYSDDEYSGSSYDYEDISSYSFDVESYQDSYENKKDKKVHEIALKIRKQVNELDDINESTTYGYSEEDLVNAADNFTNTYFGETLDSLCDRLFEKYDTFIYDSGYDCVIKLTEVLRFYGFPDPNELINTEDPYNKNIIGDIIGYIDYLNNYYKYEVKK